MNNPEKFYFRPESFSDFTKTFEELTKSGVEFKGPVDLDLFNIVSTWTNNNKLNFTVYTNPEHNSAAFSLEWGFPEGERISKDKLTLISRYLENNETLTKFSYKTQTIHPAQETLFKALARTLGFTEMKDEREKGKRSYVNISVDEVYEGEKRTYRFDSSDYLFSRNDSYTKVEFDHFTDIVWAIAKLNLKDQLKPFKTRAVH